MGQSASRLGIETLEALNKKSVTMAYSIDALDWARPIDHAKHWSPVGIAPLVHLPSYERLSAAQQLRYNQLFALGVCEQFVWFEQHLLCIVLRNLLRDEPDIPPLLREAIQHFVAEEDKHSEMFWRMCEKAEPALYPTRRFRFFNTSRLQGLALGQMLPRPRTFLLWIWAAIFFEERTVDYCRQYRKSEKTQPGFLDACFVELHEYHFKDEARHYQLDQHLLTWLYDPQPLWKRRLAARMFKVLMKAYVSPRRTSHMILDRLAEEFPELAAEVVPALRRELPQLRTNRAFHQAAFSRDAVPRTMDLFAEYPEHDGLWELFLLEDKHGPRPAPAGAP